MRAELLAPAGSYEGLRAVIKAGADAVYIGGSRFGARAYAKNPEREEMLEAIDYAHIHGKKIYLTVNTLLKNQELYKELYEFLAPYYERGADGVIVQDLGVMSFIKREFPGLPLHASTQMAVTGPRGAGLLAEAGASRIVTARELSLKEIREIYDKTKIEIESFVHGALCYSYSGMCLFSSMLGGRSGNRGRCAQPCRLPYTAYEGGRLLNRPGEEYLLSPKDMCALDLLPEILKAGVYSLKIEGRMKRPEYAAGVTAIYRKYLDVCESVPGNYQVSREDRQELLDLYQRDGFNQGYYCQQNGRDMMAAVNQKEQDRRQNQKKQRNDLLFARLKKEYLDTKKQEKIYGNLILFPGSPAILNLEFQGICVQVEGEEVQQAQNRPLSKERVCRQLGKTGETPFVFEELEVFTDGQGFLPMQSLNELRRRGLQRLEEEILKPFQRTLPQREGREVPKEELSQKPRPPVLYASVETEEQWRAALEDRRVRGIYCSLSLFGKEDLEKRGRFCREKTREAGKEFYLALPYILREDRLSAYRNLFQSLGREIDGFLVRNLEEAGYLQEAGLLEKAVCDYSVYSFNDEAQKFLEELRVKRTTVPLELNEREIREKNNRNSEMVVYGRYPMMISAQCLKKTCGRCDHKSGSVELKDRYGQVFLTKCFCDFCYNVIYNSIPTGLLKEAGQVKRLGLFGIRLNFTAETYKETKEILEWFGDAYEEETVSGKKKNPKVPEFTKGHFKRGVE